MKRILLLAGLLIALAQPSFAACPCSTCEPNVAVPVQACCPQPCAPACPCPCPTTSYECVKVRPVTVCNPCNTCNPCYDPCNPCMTGAAAPILYCCPKKQGFWKRFFSF